VRLSFAPGRWVDAAPLSRESRGAQSVAVVAAALEVLGAFTPPVVIFRQESECAGGVTAATDMDAATCRDAGVAAYGREGGSDTALPARVAPPKSA